MDNTDVRKLQLAQLDIFKELHRICMENGIQYYMIGGTLLGAVRHKGFIPWDIDLDVAMMREDYEKFAECANKLSKRFFYQSYQTDRDYYSGHARICINNTKLILANKGKSAHLKFHKGIYLDIFPLDRVPDDETEREKQRKKLMWIRKIKTLKMGSTYTAGFLGYKFAIKKINRFVLRVLPLNWLNRLQDKTMRKYENEQNLAYISSMASHYGYNKQVMKKEIYGEPALFEFEGGMFCGPEKTHEYLEKIFGDYMKLPPEEERHAQIDIYQEVIYENQN